MNLLMLLAVMCLTVYFIPERSVKVYPNNKPLITKSLKGLLKERQHAFQKRNFSELNQFKKEVKLEINKAKLHYKEKIEWELRNSNLGSAWDGMKTIVGTKPKRDSNIVLEGYRDDFQLAQAFSEFFLRFDTHDFENILCEQKNNLIGTRPIPFEEQDVINMFKHSKARKSSGPDNIEGQLLISCAEQLGSIFYYIFQLSLTQQKVPRLWKSSTVIPVAKKNHPVELNDFRPVALTSLVMKSFERLLKISILFSLLIGPGVG